MSITKTTLGRAAAMAAIAAGLLFIAVQINHPTVDLALVSTPEWAVRQSIKVTMAVCALIGITGMYLAQVGKIGILGLVGYLVFGAGYLGMLCLEVVGLVVLPSIAHTAPDYVSDVLAVATNGAAHGDVGLLQALNLVVAVGYLAGGLLFGIALFRANVLARWASLTLAIATTITAAIPLVPINQRLFAVPTGIALIGLGYSLWRQHRSAVVGPSAPTATVASVLPVR